MNRTIVGGLAVIAAFAVLGSVSCALLISGAHAARISKSGWLNSKPRRRARAAAR